VIVQRCRVHAGAVAEVRGTDVEVLRLCRGAEQVLMLRYLYLVGTGRVSRGDCAAGAELQVQGSSGAGAGEQRCRCRCRCRAGGGELVYV